MREQKLNSGATYLVSENGDLLLGCILGWNGKENEQYVKLLAGVPKTREEKRTNW